MTDFRTWIVCQSAKLGYDFNALTREDQENIISSLLSYAEDAFRSQCDYPDMRFGKRRGIYGAKSNNDLPPSSKQKEPKETRNYFLSETNSNCTDDGCENNTATSCGDTNRCVDNNCTNSAGCANDTCEDVACKNFVDCQDEGCKDEINCRNTNKCADEQGCLDDECVNVSECPDTTEDIDDPEVIDLNCTNSGSKGCLDIGKCVDDECSNSELCNDSGNSSGNCKDDSCTNYDERAQCSDSLSCIDSACLNNLASCSDSNVGFQKVCQDQMCQNIYGCDDSGFETNQCQDNSCLNSNPSDFPHCVDGGCLDQPCLNDGYDENTCKDTNCRDAGCVNEVSPLCKNEEGAADGGCINLPNCGGPVGDDVGCIDTGSSCVSTETGETDGNRECVDAARLACFDQGSSANKCRDSQYCVNQNNCFDSHCEDNSCNNASSATCRDNVDCTDNSCVNNGFCQNVVGACEDNNCQNMNCINIGLSCTNDPQSCVDTRCVPYIPPS